MPRPIQKTQRGMPRASRIGVAMRISQPLRRTEERRAARGHQYRILGSTQALTRSISRLTKTTIRAKKVMIPCTAM